MDSNHVSLNLEMLSLREKKGRVAGGKGKIKISLYDFYSKVCVNVCVRKRVVERDGKSKQAFKRFDEIKTVCQ